MKYLFMMILLCSCSAVVKKVETKYRDPKTRAKVEKQISKYLSKHEVECSKEETATHIIYTVRVPKSILPEGEK